MSPLAAWFRRRRIANLERMLAKARADRARLGVRIEIINAMLERLRRDA